MILREGDWSKPENLNAIVHLRTKNESFLKLAYIFKEMGIKHWYIHLALVDPDLEYVDPHDPNLDLVTKTKVGVEMMVNPWYWFREIVRVPQDGADPVGFKIHRGSFALIWVFFNNIDIALLLIRQQGKTIAVASLICYLMRLLKNSRTGLLTKDAGLRGETIEKIKSIRDSIPQYLWHHSKSDLDNSESFTYLSRENRLFTVIAQSNRASAENAGRGSTTARLFSDETAFTKYIRYMLPAALAAGTTARRIAEEEGIPYGNVFTTTPGKRDSEDGKFVYDMFHNGFYWDESLLDISTREELIELIRKNSKGDRVLIHAPFTHRQLGMTDLELYNAMSNAGGTKEEKLRDFGLQWTAGSMSSPLSVDEAKMIRDSVRDKIDYLEVFPQAFCLKWYYREDEIEHKLKTKHILGVDTSDAVGRDNISLVLVNSETLEVAAANVVNESNLIVFANWLAEILVRHENIILVIERKSSAATIIDSLLITLPARGIEPTRRMFNQIVQFRDSEDADLKELKKSTRPRDDRFYEIYRKYIGFVTSGPSRRLLYGEVLQTAVRMAGNKIHDKQLADEILALVVKDSRIDHKNSGHDDMVVGWLLACWFMLYGRRLDYYGVSNRILMRRHATEASGESFDDEDYEKEQQEQEQLSCEIDQLCSTIAANRNPLMRSVYERELRVKLSQLKLDTSQATTVGELQELIRNERLQARYLS